MRNTMIAGAVLLVFAVSPAWAESAHSGHMQTKATQATHQGSGKVISVDREKLKVKMDHAPIASLNWPGMTMDFAVTRAELLDKMKPGAQVSFTLVPGEQPGRWVIDQITLK